MPSTLKYVTMLSLAILASFIPQLNTGAAFFRGNLGLTKYNSATFVKSNTFSMTTLDGCYRGDILKKFNLTAGAISVMNSRFANFVSSSNGGSIYVNSITGSFTASYSSFYNCSVTGSNYGGGFYASSASFLITRCCFFYNTAQVGIGYYANITSSESLTMNDTSIAECCPLATSAGGAIYVLGGYNLDYRINNTDNMMTSYAGSFYNYLSLGVEIHYIQMIRLTAISSYEIWQGSGTPIIDTGNIINNTVSYGVCRSSLTTTMENFVVFGCGTYFAGNYNNGGTIIAVGCYFDVTMTSCSWLTTSSCTVSKAPSIQITMQSLKNCADGSVCSNVFSNQRSIPKVFSSLLAISIQSFLWEQ